MAIEEPAPADVARRLIDDECDLLAHLSPDSSWSYVWEGRGAASQESFRHALGMPDAATALAMLRLYSSMVDLAGTETWSVSAMPSYSGPKEWRRFATISTGHTELFFVWFRTDTGHVESWGLRTQPGLEVPDYYLQAEVADNTDTILIGETMADLVRALRPGPVADAVKVTREHRQHARRKDWHNPLLADYLCPSEALAEKPEEPEAPEELERRYVQRVVRQRLHQSELRRLALLHWPAQCHYCHVDVLEVLQAAHLQPDSEGGPASVENVRLLCANHHLAFDRGLLQWDGEQFEQAEGKPCVPPAKA